jgi:hypothetical protein
MISQEYEPLGYQQLTATQLASAQKLTVPAGANVALISVEVAAVRWRDDGTAPTTSIGMYLPNGLAPFEYSGTLDAIEFIAATGSPLVNVSYYKVVG